MLEYLCSPINGEVLQVFQTKHTILLKSSEGLEMMIHIGLDTVTLEGEGSEVRVNEGENVIVGQHLVKVDLEFLKSKVIKTITPIFIINHEDKTIKKHLGYKTNKGYIMKVM